MATPNQQSSPARDLPMLVKKLILSISTASYLSLVRRIPKHNVLVIGGDMNAQIGKNVNLKFSLHNSSNWNGEHLIDFTLENVSILNFREERENYGPTPTQKILNER